ncbi:glycosyltransferase family 4 protein [Calycina marina]|uniref:GDP-Man:Man(3)GlcNAc(2)-PP-Dol alpha-1,2-mannosyltransferase n=1 Tax=Calycina marina TaxID=1763456 RepID=A0A9P8CEI9_9HELO|nr:glycosyltransferase family 4 protein [Calycina marina]
MAETCKMPDSSEIWSLGSKWTVIAVTALVAMIPMATFFLGPKIFFKIGSTFGYYLKKKTAGRRAQILELVKSDEKELVARGGGRSSDEWEKVNDEATTATKEDADWDGIVGFFHPFCNAGGGGERVLWAAIRATQKRWPNCKCIVYTGDHDADKAAILARVKDRFNIDLHAPTITFLYLTTRSWVLASSWPRFTLLGQSFGSLVLAWDAFSLLAPDIFVDTMGYAFSLAFCKLLFPEIPLGAYVHYPTISTDMVESLNSESATGSQGVNAGKGSGATGAGKKLYWQIFAMFYSWVGASIDVVMTNSSWTLEHIKSIWGEWRQELGKSNPVTVYPPVAVEELERAIDISASSENKREKALLYIAQFRPEKNHHLILESFAQFMATESPATKGAKLILIGSVRDDADSKRVYELRLLANELQIKDFVEFHLDAQWSEILDWLSRASVGVNGMWNEHFGIGVVEYQAAGLISVVHNSGGPKRDIVIDIDDKPTGYHATTAEEFATGFEKALALEDKMAWRIRARKSSQRFTDETFAKGWIVQMEKLVKLRRS